MKPEERKRRDARRLAKKYDRGTLGLASAVAPDETAALNWQDPAACRAWLETVQTATYDLADVADDQTRRPGRREHGRHGARQMYKETIRALRQRIEVGFRGLPASSEPPVPASGSGGAS